MGQSRRFRACSASATTRGAARSPSRRRRRRTRRAATDRRRSSSSRNRAEEAAARRRARADDALRRGAKDVAILCARAAISCASCPRCARVAIPFAAVELDSLADAAGRARSPGLTHALVQPADRLASFSVLRAPWCGLVLADLLSWPASISNTGSPASSSALDSIEGLSDDGAARLARIAIVLASRLRRAGARAARRSRARRVARARRTRDRRRRRRSRGRRGFPCAAARACGGRRHRRLAGASSTSSRGAS